MKANIALPSMPMKRKKLNQTPVNILFNHDKSLQSSSKSFRINIVNLASSFLYSLEFFYTGLDSNWTKILENKFGYKDTGNIII